VADLHVLYCYEAEQGWGAQSATSSKREFADEGIMHQVYKGGEEAILVKRL